MRVRFVLSRVAGGLAFALTVGGSACVAAPELASRPDATRSDFELECPGSALPETSPRATFSDLYAKLFSANGAARCADVSCHGGTGQGPSLGGDPRTAYEGLVAYGVIDPKQPVTDAGALVVPDDVAVLINIVSPGTLADGGVRPPRMPRPVCGTRPLTPVEIEAIRAWGLAGAKND